MFSELTPPNESPRTRRKLEALGLSWPLLWTAIRAGEEARRTATPEEPPSSGDLKDWIARVGALRSELRRHGWTAADNEQIPISVNPGQDIGIGQLLDYAATASPDSDPVSGYPRRNEPLNPRHTADGLFSLAEAGRPDLLEEHIYARLTTWFLITFRTVRHSSHTGIVEAVVVSELALPGARPGRLTGLDDEQHVQFHSWRDHILLPESIFPLPDRVAGDEGVPTVDVSP